MEVERIGKTDVEELMRAISKPLKTGIYKVISEFNREGQSFLLLDVLSEHDQLLGTMPVAIPTSTIGSEPVIGKYLIVESVGGYSRIEVKKSVI